MTIAICVGSSCHLKGSYDVIAKMKAALAEHKLEDKVDLCAAFCLGKCSTTGVSIRVDDQIISGVNVDNFDDIFKQYVLGGLGT